MADFEGLGVFYLGKRVDPRTLASTDDLVLYDSRDLVTHALIVGMTGSGKTGLGVALIEEAAIDAVPVIVIDPKGDLTNLLLTFPDLGTEDFLPWVDADGARRAGADRAAFAAAEAARWRLGLADWGQDGARIQRLRDSAAFTVYTPGSSAGRPVSVLASFARPSMDDLELARERAHTTVAGLLGLAGIDAEPLRSREHILLTTILLDAWKAGDDPDLALLIQRTQQPPMARIGVIDVESFYPSKDRFELAMRLNALIASPGFEAWTEGDPLDVAAFLRTDAGKPRVSIFSIAHLDDGQRMFFVSLLLNAMAGWMRSQSGTSSLRAMLYMDEIFGYFPPTANPPSKGPLLTLLKQGRAAGVGVVLATQNPVDLDYKGLSNIGTWWLGRLQTERDKARLLDGLQAAGDQGGFDRAEIDRLLSGLTSRVFLTRNVHDEGLTLFRSRWALSYLRGPLGRDEVRRLAGGSDAAGQPVSPPGSVHRHAPASSSSDGSASGASPQPTGPRTAPRAGVAGARPMLPPDVPQHFAPGVEWASSPLEPVLYGAANVRFVDPKAKLDVTRLVAWTTPIVDAAVPVDWERASPVDWAPEQLDQHPPDDASYVEIPEPALRARSYAGWTRQLVSALAARESLELLRSPSTGELARVDEPEREFRARLQQASREARDRAVDALRRRSAPRLAALEERERRARQAVERESQQASGQKLQTIISVGATVFGALLGRRAISASTIGRATTAARGVGRSMKESEDIERARETLAAVAAQRAALDEELQRAVEAIEAAGDPATETFDRIVVRPKRTHISVKLVTLLWQEPER
ncbi:MAG: DUF87 domain-containing protein [Vicinamibacterales bacterium]